MLNPLEVVHEDVERSSKIYWGNLLQNCWLNILGAVFTTETSPKGPNKTASGVATSGELYIFKYRYTGHTVHMYICVVLIYYTYIVCTILYICLRNHMRLVYCKYEESVYISIDLHCHYVSSLSLCISSFNNLIEMRNVQNPYDILWHSIIYTHCFTVPSSYMAY